MVVHQFVTKLCSCMIRRFLKLHEVVVGSSVGRQPFDG